MFLAPRQRVNLVQALVELDRAIVDEEIDIAEEEEARRRRVQRRRRRWWVRPWLLRRPLHGYYERLMQELRREDVQSFKNFMRVEPEMFQELVERLTPRLEKEQTVMRRSLEPGLRLAVALRYYATGDTYKSLMYGFRVAANTIGKIVREVSIAIVEEYAHEVIACPTTTEEWLPIATQFGERWNFHHAVGALDGKHVPIHCPPNAGSNYYNYKGFHSIILMALVDADYRFIWVDVGAQGCASDCTVFNASELKQVMEDGTVGLPDPAPLPNDDLDMPYFLIGDDAFPLKKWLMKPYSRRNLDDAERIFNYRLSRARRVVENAFGILANRFQCLLKRMNQRPETVQDIVLALCCLHNMMRIRYPAVQNADLDREDEDHNLVPGAWRQDGQLLGFFDAGMHNMGRAAKDQRDYLKAFYNSPAGSVPWQNDML